MLRPREPRQQHRDDAAAKSHLGRAKNGIVRRQGDIAGHGELHGTAEAVAMHRCQGDFRTIPKAHDDLEILLQCTAHGVRVELATLATSNSQEKPAEKARPTTVSKT